MSSQCAVYDHHTELCSGDQCISAMANGCANLVASGASTKPHLRDWPRAGSTETSFGTHSRWTSTKNRLSRVFAAWPKACLRRTIANAWTSATRRPRLGLVAVVPFARWHYKSTPFEGRHFGSAGPLVCCSRSQPTPDRSPPKSDRSPRNRCLLLPILLS